MISFDDVEKLIAAHASPGIRPGLERMERLLPLLGNPQAAYPAVHVVGTNGKGSTCAFLASVFEAAGYRTALYTSPHLESPGERLLAGGKPLTPERWFRAAEETVRRLTEDAVLREDPPSYFELVTAAAFLLTREEKADVLVAEAGLGGRLDATNLLSDVACTAVASISTDHTEYLGDTLEKIAREKFAVIRPGVPACYLGDAPELIPLFEEFCAAGRGLVVSRDARVGSAEVSEEGCVFDFAAPGLELKRVRTGLIGRYQVSNASLALVALSRLRGRFERLTDSAVREGMSAARWPGRLEIVSRSPLIVLDGGHNRDGVAKLAESVRELWGGKGKKIGVVYCVMKDKDYPSCLNILNGLDASFYATCVPGMERSLTASALAEEARRLTWRSAAGAFENPLDAVERASGENDVVLVCGSLYLIGWIRPRLLSLHFSEKSPSAQR
ncbi:MAG: bifunctional folylpolyglutamate synthase/dihydrofolate synthase [Synergistaceae bacterium]|jgi:dihydrofolate synthase/folylpolyglutamate synthase|nr:bifunctional folylpolyglutamate synthase/dihydrofolate synthase [Synergistaceae bacterium]